MKHIITYLFIFSFITTVTTQTFVRSQLPTELNTPWEMTYGPSSTLHIESKEAVNSIEVYNIAGDLIRIEKENTASLKISDLPEGIYLTRLNMISGSQIIKRFVKQ